MSKLNFPVFVISLARATARRESISALLDADLGAGGYEIVDAVDGQEIDLTACHPPVRQDRCDDRYRHTLIPGEIGVTLSNYKLWARIVAEKIPAALILEDDARWDADFWDVATAITECEWEWDAVLLHHARPRRGKRVICKLTETQNLVRYQRQTARATTYMVTAAGAEKLCRQFSEIIGPMDLVWRDHWYTDMTFYEVTPGVANHSGAESFIGKRKTHRTFAATLCRRAHEFKDYQLRKKYHRTHPPKRKA